MAYVRPVGFTGSKGSITGSLRRLSPRTNPFFVLVLSTKDSVTDQSNRSKGLALSAEWGSSPYSFSLVYPAWPYSIHTSIYLRCQYVFASLRKEDVRLEISCFEVLEDHIPLYLAFLVLT
jgi:hypothetical protein